MALDIETRVTKVALGMETNTHMEFVVIKPEVDIVDNVLSFNLNRFKMTFKFTEHEVHFKFRDFFPPPDAPHAVCNLNKNSI